MKTNRRPAKTISPAPDISLTKVLGQNEQVKHLVEAAADDLSSLNSNLRATIDAKRPPAVAESAIKKSEAAEEKIADAAEKLTVVNEALETEVQELQSLHQKFAATVDLAEVLRQAALHDVLTGLPNRALFCDRLEHGLQQAKRHSWTMAVLFVDLDEFKKINDSYGHQAGDIVLKTIATRLKIAARSDDTISRHGGDEFLCLLMGGGDALDISAIAANIIKMIAMPCTITVDGVATTLNVNASIGIAIFPQDGGTPDALVNRADEAMYSAKRNRSRYAFSSTAKK